MLALCLAVLLQDAWAKPVSLFNHSLVDHLQQGKHLFVLFSSGRFDQPDAHHHVAPRSSRVQTARKEERKAVIAGSGVHDRRFWKELDDAHREVELHSKKASGTAEQGMSSAGVPAGESDRKAQRGSRDEGRTWEQLSALYKDDPLVLIGYLNCKHSAEEAQMCQEHGVTKYPTLIHYKGDEWSTPGVHQHYEGERDLESLKSFVESYIRQPKIARTEL
eukprot:TRINITY_DN83695_c0_g1_i1.p1 TRINITY_DN83695_c0_g1~~TRINITY_DN83695_c0_g1_i1.p1  ORF type:complete len:228 (-),score=58.59 TRINITY_DN83695_c0_g1_i1:27-683(-)